VFRISMIAVVLLGVGVIAPLQAAGGGVKVVTTGIGTPQFHFQGTNFNSAVQPMFRGPSTGMPQFHFEASILGGFVQPGFHGPGFPFSGIWGGPGGDIPPYLYGYKPPKFQPYTRTYTPAYTPPARPQPLVARSNQFPAVLYMQLPMAGRVWANGNEITSEPTAEWTLKSPMLQPGEKYTFEVKARWMNNGNAFEYTRTIEIEGGKQNRIQVMAGTPLKDSLGSVGQ